MKAVVVGGGLGGLAAAARLAHAGHAVTLVEKNEHLGGKMDIIEDRGYLFDCGPAFLTYPQVLDRLFASLGRRREDYLPLVRLDPQERAFFEDGTRLDVWQDAARLAREIARLSPGDVGAFDAFRAYAERMHGRADARFFWRNIEGPGDVAREVGLKGLALLPALDPHRTAGGVLASRFRDPRLRQIFLHFLRHLGSSPFRAPAVFASVHHLRLAFGVWYPMGGMNQLAQALGTLVQELGVELRLGAPAQKILMDGRRARGVAVAGREIAADAVVVNADYARAHRDLLPPTETLRRLDGSPARREPSCSGLSFFFGLDRRYDALAHHNVFLAKDPAREFRDIHDRGVPTEDPTLYVCAPSRTDPDLAPPGGENLAVLLHAPHLRPGQDWHGVVQGCRRIVLSKLERMGLEGLSRHIQVEHVRSPAELDRLYGLNRGSIYGFSSHGRLRGAFKPGNRSGDFENLYFAGGSVHPGPGAAMALMSGQVAAETLLRDAGVKA